MSISINDVRQRLRARRRIRAIAVGLLLLATLGLTALWIEQVVFRPRLTPVLLATVTDYAWPVDPNAWAREDAARLQMLHRHSLQVLDLSPDWRSSELALKRLDADLAALAASRSLADTVVFYFSMHSAVDSEGKPYLLPAEASPLDSATWLPVSAVLDRISAALPRRVHKLVLLDSNRTGMNWRIGQLHNTFAQRLSDAIDPERHPNLVIVNSTAPDQSAWSSPALGGSAFGYFVSRGLAGAADTAAGSKRPVSAEAAVTVSQGGNGDGRVSVTELVDYLNDQLAAWCTAHDLPVQRVQRTPVSSGDCSIAWSLPSRAAQQFEQGLELNTARSVSPTDLDTLWRRLGELPRQRLLAVVPEALNDLEHRLLWLEKLSAAGTAYQQQAVRERTSIDRRLSDIEQQLTASEIRHSPVALRRALLRQPAALGGSPPPSLRLAATLGTISADQLDSAERQWNELIAGADPQRLQATVSQLQTLAASGENGGSIDDAQFLRLLQRYQTLDRWSRRDALAKLLELRATADRLAVMQLPEGQQDIRSIPWVTPLLRQADQQRLVAEDWLLAGQSAASAQIDPQLAAASTAYAAAADRLLRIAAAIALRDDAAQRLPAIAEAWAAIPPQLAGDAAADDAAGDSSAADAGDRIPSWILPAISDCITLSQQLDRVPTTADDTSVPFLTTADQLRQTLAQIDAQLERWLVTLGDETLERPWLQLRAALSLPFLPWQQRRDLRLVHDRIAQSQVAEYQSGDAVTTESDDVAWDQRPGNRPALLAWPTIDRPLSWSVHPAVLISGNESTGSDPGATQGLVPAESSLARMEQLGYLVRNSLGHWTDGAAMDRWSDAPTAADDTAVAARWQRRALPLVAARPQHTPLQSRWREDLQRLLVWQADRQLTAFLGSPAASSGPPRPPFFDTACSRCLDWVEELGPQSAALQRDIEQIRRRQIARRLAARTGLATSADTSPLPQDAAEFAIAVTVTPLAETQLPADAFPSGLPSVWVQTAQRQIVTQAATVSLPLSTSQTFELSPRPGIAGLEREPPESLAAGAEERGASGIDTPRLTALTTFRGNEFDQPFVVNRLQGTTISYRPHRYGASTITLLGQQKKRASVMFVLDCSQSMSEPLASESASDSARSKLDVAKAALVQMLDELSQQDGTRVGVIFFGHRIAWTRSAPPRLSLSPGAGVDVPEGLMPSRDVELLLPLGRFDTGGVLRRLDVVQAWGQTPLNQAIVEATGAFASDDPDTEKSIIVITDGRDYQFTPSRSDIRQPPRTTHNDALRAGQQAGVPIYLLGFGLEPAERAQAEADFQQLAEATGGAATTVDDAGELMRQLRARLSLGSYTVQGRREVVQRSPGQPPSVTAVLNGTVTVDPREFSGETFELNFGAASQSFPLAGGEALRIRLSADSNRFLPIPFDWQFPQTIELVSGASQQRSPYVLRAHRPQRQGQRAIFPISIQSTRDAVTPRPAETWLAVTPIVDGVEDREHRYWFYDVNYEPNQPVPLLQWEANHWPNNAASARLDFWCKFERSVPFAEYPLHEVIASPEAYVGLPVPEFPEVKLQITAGKPARNEDDYVVNVIQLHDAAVPDIAQIRVEFRTAKIFQPKRVTHQFDPANGVVSHTYTYDAADATGIERSDLSRIVLTSRTALASGSLHPPGGQPIEVDLYSGGDVITLTAPR